MTKALSILAVLAATLAAPVNGVAAGPASRCSPAAGKAVSCAPAARVAAAVRFATPAWHVPAGATVVPQPCPEAPGGLCGSIQVPFDRSNPALGTTTIAFELYPHTDSSQPALGTLVTNPGGPGGSTTSDRGAWLGVFGPVLDRYDLLLVDDRGRGKSGAIDCGDLQHGIGDFLTAIGECGAQLGLVAGAYGTDAVADDMDDVRAALGIDKLTYYGVSYGGVDVEAYATRHGDHLAAVVADAPWSSLDDPFQQFEVPALVREVALSCGRAPGCDASNPDPAADLAWLMRRLARAPLVGTGIDFSGTPTPVRLDEATAINWIVSNSSANFAPPGELAAAARALRRGDPTPLLRLAAEQVGTFPYENGDPADFSMGSYVATWCADSLEAYDTTAPPAVRQAQYDAALRALPRHAFAPFSVPGYAQFLLEFEGGNLCVPWPTPRQDVVAPGATYPDVPTLVLTGDMDAVVPSEYVDSYAARWPHHTLLHVAGAGHGTLFWSDCARGIILRFLLTYETGDTSCTAVPIPSFATADFPLDVRDATQAAIEPGARFDRSQRLDRRAATVAALTVLDALKRTATGGAPLSDSGLRGGSFQVDGGPAGGLTADLAADRYARDEAVSGTVHWHADGTVEAHLTLAGADAGQLHVSGSLLVSTADALHLHGELGGRHVSLIVPAT